ncbi:hypothetical protein HYFRA_00013726 [Hymenoscyphus fraxineus]|uniref:Uncharacterized protein n=1 Tax=Hymenoscyphus fraxineus TaxID=746836 RepID=A0A9N9L7Z5_9HELO|nr:hypothetical protein HYFRA_00013726 [Hymenoscyphus fraxineus]
MTPSATPIPIPTFAPVDNRDEAWAESVEFSGTGTSGEKVVGRLVVVNDEITDVLVGEVVDDVLDAVKATLSDDWNQIGIPSPNTVQSPVPVMVRYTVLRSLGMSQLPFFNTGALYEIVFCPAGNEDPHW